MFWAEIVTELLFSHAALDDHDIGVLSVAFVPNVGCECVMRENLM